MWKNSSAVLSRPAKNWTSSTRSAPHSRYLRRKSCIVFLERASTKSLVYRSEETMATRAPGRASGMAWAMAWSRWVLPRPESPWRKSGFQARPGFEATACAAAKAKRFDSPTTKVSKV